MRGILRDGDQGYDIEKVLFHCQWVKSDFDSPDFNGVISSRHQRRFLSRKTGETTAYLFVSFLPRSNDFYNLPFIFLGKGTRNCCFLSTGRMFILLRGKSMLKLQQVIALRLRSHEYRSAVTKMRISAYTLPIETGKWKGIPREERTCLMCDSKENGNEAHYLVRCNNQPCSLFDNKWSRRVRNLRAKQEQLLI